MIRVDRKLKNARWLLLAIAGALALPAAAMAEETVSLKAVNQGLENQYVRHFQFHGKLTAIDPSNPTDMADATFIVHPALDGKGGVSFESTNYRGFYLRHENWELVLSDSSKPTHPDSFKGDASFFPRAEVYGGKGTVSYESSNFEHMWIRHKDYQLWVNAHDGSELFSKDASFVKVKGLAAPAAVGGGGTETGPGTAAKTATAKEATDVYPANDGNSTRQCTMNPGDKGTFIKTKNGEVDWVLLSNITGECNGIQGWVWNGGTLSIQ